MHGLVADGTLRPGLLAQRQVVQHAGPAVNMATASDASCHRRVEADRAGRHLMAVDALNWKENGGINKKHTVPVLSVLGPLKLHHLL